LESRAKFSPVDNSVVVQANLQIYRTTLVDGFLTSPTQLTFVGSNFDPAWSKDNSLLAYESNASGHYAIWRMQATGDDMREIPLQWGTRVNDVDWLPSGDRIIGSAYAIDSHSWDLVVFDTVGTVVSHLAPSAETESRPRVSPDGKTVAFERSGWVWLVNADNSDVRRLVRGINPAWSHSGEWIVYIAADWSAHNGEGTVWKVRVASGETRRLTKGP
jgi:Tol biopolymer transport system component